MTPRPPIALLGPLLVFALGANASCAGEAGAGAEGETASTLPTRVSAADCRASARPLSPPATIDMDIDGDLDRERVEILRTDFVFPLLLHWRVGGDERWAVANHRLVTLRPGASPTRIKDFFAADLRPSIAVDPLPLPQTFRVSWSAPAGISAENLPRLLREFDRLTTEWKQDGAGPGATIRSVTPDYVYFLDRKPRDRGFKSHQRPVMEQLRAPEAWDFTQGDDDIRVAVIDSGADITHPDLDGNLLRVGGRVVGRNVLNGSNDVADVTGHGTQCAGIIGAEGDSPDEEGVAGVNWDVSIIPIKAFDRGCGCISQILDAFRFAIANGADVISCSWGGPDSAELRDVVGEANAAGILVVASAGNEERNLDTSPGEHFPAAYNLPNVLSVAASRGNAPLIDTGFGARRVQISAPGVPFLTTFPRALASLPDDPYQTLPGSSAATAFVAGAAALVKAHNPNLGHLDIRRVLIDSTDIFPAFPPSRPPSCSKGRLNLERAVKQETRSPSSGC